MHAVKQVNGRVLWANTHLLFWLSLIPFVTSWMGENEFATIPVIVYGLDLFMAGFAYYILSQSLIKLHGKNSTLASAIGSDTKGKISIILYAVGISLSLIHPWIGCFFYVVVAGIWVIPDKRLEKRLRESATQE